MFFLPFEGFHIGGAPTVGPRLSRRGYWWFCSYLSRVAGWDSADEITCCPLQAPLYPHRKNTSKPTQRT